MDVIYKILSDLDIGKTVLYIILVASIFIDITPKIKWNPIKSIFGYLGNCFNSSIEKEIEEFKQEVNGKFDQLKQEQLAQRETLDRIVVDQENKEISRLRWEIIDFENSLQNGVKYSREHYRHILDDAMKYQRMMSSMKEDNNEDEVFSEVLETVERIKKHYDEKREDLTVLFF